MRGEPHPEHRDRHYRDGSVCPPTPGVWRPDGQGRGRGGRERLVKADHRPGRGGSGQGRPDAGGGAPGPPDGYRQLRQAHSKPMRRRRGLPGQAGDGPPAGDGNPDRDGWAGRAFRGPVPLDGGLGLQRRASGSPGRGDSPGQGSQGVAWRAAPVSPVWQDQWRPAGAAGPRDGVVGWRWFRMKVPPGARGMPERGWGPAPKRLEAPQNGPQEGRSQDELEQPAMPAKGGRGPRRGPAQGPGESPPAASAPRAGAGLRSPGGGSGPGAWRRPAAPAGGDGATPTDQRGARRGERRQLAQAGARQPSSPTRSSWRGAGVWRSHDPGSRP